MPAISITTPSFGRQQLLERQHRNVLAQSEQDFEWLILDDSPAPAPYFAGLADPRIRYHHHAGARLSIGVKRNWLAERAEAPVIAHFDDDDYYAPDYLKTMLEKLSRHGADMVKFSAWHLYSIRHGQFAWWDTTVTRGLHFRIAAQDAIAPVMLSEEDGRAFANNYAGFGYSYVYRRSLWRDVRFPDAQFGEDYGFAAAAIAAGGRFAHFPETDGLCMQIMRPDGVSIAWPQWLLPGFLVPRLFPAAAQELLLP
jgi:glycosyltransferase involved in cell wall biosynthesis